MNEHELAKSVMRSLSKEPEQWTAQKVTDHGTTENILCRTFGFDVISVSSDGAISGHGSATFRIQPREGLQGGLQDPPGHTW